MSWTFRDSTGAIKSVTNNSVILNPISTATLRGGNGTNAPTALVNGAGASDGTYFYLCGGTTNGINTGALSNVRRYDPATNVWAAFTNALPVAIYGAHAEVVGTKLYVYGGVSAANTVQSALYSYDLTTGLVGTWTTLAAGDTRVSAKMVTDGINLYVFAGSTTVLPAGSALNTIRRYNVGANTWSTLAPPFNPTSRWSHAGGYSPSLNSFIFAGGWNPATGAPHSDTWKYDIAANTWLNLSLVMPFPTYGAGSCILNDQLFVVGGLNGSTVDNFNQIQVFDIASSSWDCRASWQLQAGVYYPAVAAQHRTDDSIINCVGGQGTSGAVSVTQRMIESISLISAPFNGNVSVRTFSSPLTKQGAFGPGWLHNETSNYSQQGSIGVANGDSIVWPCRSWLPVQADDVELVVS
jgi:N-acetylneuraminic acid mutarotase